MEMVNGYVFLDLTKANVYAKALKVLGADKPVVIKEGSGAPYFVDSLTLDGTNVVITKGGKTITIANDNTITNVGDIQNHLYLIDFRLTSDTAEYDLRITAISTKENITKDDLSKLDYISIANDNNFSEVYIYNYYNQEYQQVGGESVYGVEDDSEIIGLTTIKKIF